MLTQPFVQAVDIFRITLITKDFYSQQNTEAPFVFIAIKLAVKSLEFSHEKNFTVCFVTVTRTVNLNCLIENIYLSSIVRKILTLSHVDYNNRFSSDSQLFDTILTWKSIPLIVFKENFKHILNNYCFIGCILAYYFYEVNIRFFSRLCFSNWRQMQQC